MRVRTAGVAVKVICSEPPHLRFSANDAGGYGTPSTLPLPAALVPNAARWTGLTTAMPESRQSFSWALNSP